MLIINHALISIWFDIYITIQILRQEATEISMYSYHGKSFNSLERYRYYTF